MKLRHLFVITCCLLTVIPLALFWAWPYSKALESEVRDVRQRHLVIAQNLSATFERYYQDVTGIFTIIDSESESQLNSKNFKQLLASYDFSMVAKFDNDGKLTGCLFYKQKSCPPQLDSDIFRLMVDTSNSDNVTLSTVTVDKSYSNTPILLVVQKYSDHYLLGYLSTQYIVDMGRRVSFGEKGHAAIVDQAGNVLAHPLSSWIEARKNISAVSTVQKMLAGKTGVEEFYSPALKGDMIAGYTFVPNAGWGVMVPQPLEELRVKAEHIDETAMMVMFLGVALALLITIPISFSLIKPLESLLATIRRIENGKQAVDVDFKTSRVMPKEIREIKNSFSSMMEKIESNKSEISKLAYFDVVTELPNRRYFQLLSEQWLGKAEESDLTGALVFIDLDDFKLVNDTYGHKIGDELLSQFAVHLSRHFDIESKEVCLLEYYDELPDIIPARLGGDEFAILFKNIRSKEDVYRQVQLLFDEVFTTYSLPGGAEVDLTGSAGIAFIPEHGLEYDEIIKHADVAMYKAKLDGKNSICAHAV